MTHTEDEHTLLVQDKWRFIDQTTLNPAFEALQSYATDDMLCRAIGAKEVPPTVRAWVHCNTVSLGVQDAKLPDVQKGIEYLQNQGYHVVFRNSGGLAVVLDSEILNLTLVFPDIERGIAIDRGYKAMFNLVKDMFVDYSEVIKAYEIKNSYCPGSYDLSIDGKKFAGISQRRLAKGVAVQIYLAVGGNQDRRADLIHEFYKRSGKDKQNKYFFPEVDKRVMSTLSLLLHDSFTINDIVLRLLNSMRFYAKQLESGILTAGELHFFSNYYERIMKRNEKILFS